MNCYKERIISSVDNTEMEMRYHYCNQSIDLRQEIECKKAIKTYNLSQIFNALYTENASLANEMIVAIEKFQLKPDKSIREYSIQFVQLNKNTQYSVMGNEENLPDFIQEGEYQTIESRYLPESKVFSHSVFLFDDALALLRKQKSVTVFDASYDINNTFVLNKKVLQNDTYKWMAGISATLLTAGCVIPIASHYLFDLGVNMGMSCLGLSVVSAIGLNSLLFMSYNKNYKTILTLPKILNGINCNENQIVKCKEKTEASKRSLLEYDIDVDSHYFSELHLHHEKQFENALLRDTHLERCALNKVNRAIALKENEMKRFQLQLSYAKQAVERKRIILEKPIDEIDRLIGDIRILLGMRVDIQRLLCSSQQYSECIHLIGFYRWHATVQKIQGNMCNLSSFLFMECNRFKYFQYPLLIQLIRTTFQSLDADFNQMKTGSTSQQIMMLKKINDSVQSCMDIISLLENLKYASRLYVDNHEALRSLIIRQESISSQVNKIADELDVLYQKQKNYKAIIGDKREYLLLDYPIYKYMESYLLNNKELSSKQREQYHMNLLLWINRELNKNEVNHRLLGR